VDLAELIDRGVRAYVTGRIPEALAAFQQALALDPENTKARGYLVRIQTTHPGALQPAPVFHGSGHGRVPLPGPAARPEPPPPDLKPFDVLVPAPATAPDLSPHDGQRAGADGHAHTPAHVDEEYAPSPWDEGPATGATIVLADDASSPGLDLSAVSEKSDLHPLVPQGQAADGTGPPTDVDLWLKAAKELFALGDFTGSLELIEKILTVDPDHGEARDYLRQNEATLVSMYESKLGPLHAIPRLAIKPEEVMWLNLDHRAGFLLAQIDGSVDYEGLFAVSGLPRLDTARILANLIADGVIRS
jgi:tetratricopeptide (TPR) repeat protein